MKAPTDVSTGLLGSLKFGNGEVAAKPNEPNHRQHDPDAAAASPPIYGHYIVAPHA